MISNKITNVCILLINPCLRMPSIDTFAYVQDNMFIKLFTTLLVMVYCLHVHQLQYSHKMAYCAAKKA